MPTYNPTYSRNDVYAQEGQEYGGRFTNNAEMDEEYGGDGVGDLYGDSRNGFIKKVYTLLSLQLLVTAGVSAWAMNSQAFTKIFVNTPVIIIVSVLIMAISLVIGCCTEVVRKYGLPILIFFTLLFSILVGIICSMTSSKIVLMAAGITAVIVIGLTAYACTYQLYRLKV